ncbi:MAG: S1 RNA-binding domain-containing protein, partial [Lachnospiraceae bacterium]|nr:S1 RNA-binding domain-containing protein [Lachnospiraceae bacterium]
MEIGRINRLKVVKKESFGYYLSENGDLSEERVLLPIKQVPSGADIGDELEVFIYRDSQDRPIATTNTP